MARTSLRDTLPQVIVAGADTGPLPALLAAGDGMHQPVGAVLDHLEGWFDPMRAPTDPCRCSECKYMKLNTLEKVRDCMQNLSPRIELPEAIIRRAQLPIQRMLEISARSV